MRTHPWRHFAFLLALIAVGIGLLLWSRTSAQPRLEHATLTDGSPVTLAVPAAHATARVALLMPAQQKLSDAELLGLAEQSGARILQLVADTASCSEQQLRLQAASRFLDGEPNVVAGVGPGAAQAWRWLAMQNDDKAKALSVDFNLSQADCPDALPATAAHGHWNVAWNNNPDDASARFARSQANAETRIGDYDLSLKQLLSEQLQRLLQGEHDAMPVIEVAAEKPGDTVTLFYSGDGGWRDLDRDVAAQLAQRGLPVVGVDALRYFWQHKSPEQGAADLSRLMQTYRQKWGAKRFVLIGFSFGADTLPAFYNRLPSTDQQQVDSIILLALARSGSFEIEVQGWLGKAGAEAPIGPELLKLPVTKVLCIYGEEEGPESGCTLAGAPGEIVRLPGGHHYDGDYPALAERLKAGILKRQAQ